MPQDREQAVQVPAAALPLPAAHDRRANDVFVRYAGSPDHAHDPAGLRIHHDDPLVRRDEVAVLSPWRKSVD